MTDGSTPRLAPILPPDWNEAALDALSVFPAGRDFVQNGYRTKGSALGMNLMGTQLHHPALAKASWPLNAYVSKGNLLSTRVRELLILRVAWLTHSEYEYVQHRPQGRAAGLTDADLARVEQGPDAPGWDPADADVVRAVDEMQRGGRIEPATLERLARHFSVPQLMDLIFVTGCYGTMSVFCNTWNVQLEPGTPGLDAATRARMMASG